MPRRLVPVALARLDPQAAVEAVAVALDGRSDALLPVPPDDPDARSLHALAPNTALSDDEDDDDDPTALVLATSGSTGTPKGALLSASALRASAEATHERLGGPGRWLLALAPHHVAGVQVLVRSVVAGTVPAVLDLAGGFDLHAFASASQRLSKDDRCYTALVPTQLARLLDAGGEVLWALIGFDGVLVGGAATTPALLARAREAGVRVVTTYGMSETSGGCVYDGVPLAGVGVRTDEDRVRLGGSVVARGYRGRPDAAEFSLDKLSVDKLSLDKLSVDELSTDGGTRWFRTSDLGTWDGQRLQVLGRADDVIVTGGLKVSPQAVEAALAEAPGVHECVVVGVPDDEWGQRVVALVVPTQPGRPPSLAELRQHVSGALGAHAAPRAMVLADRLPLLGIGKPDRRAAVALARAAALDADASS